MRREAVDVATAAAAKLIRARSTARKGSALIDQAIAEVGKKLH